MTSLGQTLNVTQNITKGWDLLWYQEHDRKKLQEIVSGNVHHGLQRHRALLSLSLRSLYKELIMHNNKEGQGK